MDGLPALDLPVLVIEVLHSAKHIPARGNPWRDETQSKHTNTKSKKHGNRDDIELFNVDHVITNAKPSQIDAMLYVVEENEAVIKMIIKGRSPAMRHVSRTPKSRA